jgi:quinol monooxygenase YgiN
MRSMPALEATPDMAPLGATLFTRIVNRHAKIAAVALVTLLIAAASPQGETEMTSAAPIVRLAELQIDPAQRETYLALLREEIEASIRLEPGVLTLDAVALKNAPDQIRLMEIYADQAAYEAHLKSAHFIKYKNATAGMVTSLTLRETVPIALRGKR